jgi:hypothetical protein
MKIIALSMIKNEEDILEQFIRHTLSYCDGLYIYDHFSIDGSRKIIDSCSKEGLKVFLINNIVDQYINPTVAHIQGDVMNTMLRAVYSNYGSAVYLPLDADEFIIHEGNCIAFKNEMNSLQYNCWFKVPWRTLIASTQSEINVKDSISNFNYAEKKSLIGQSHSKCIFKINNQIKIEKLLISYGNHEVIDSENKLLPFEVSGMYYLHVPIRSKSQLAKKIIMGWLSNVLRRGRDGNSAVHWGVLYNEMIKNNSLDIFNSSAIYKMAGYSFHDLTLPKNIETISVKQFLKYELRYFDMRDGDISIILKDLEQMLHHMYDKKTG